jgi:hypothetical protein
MCNDLTEDEDTCALMSCRVRLIARLAAIEEEARAARLQLLSETPPPGSPHLVLLQGA